MARNVSGTEGTVAPAANRPAPASHVRRGYRHWAFLGLSMVSVMAGPLAVTSVAVIAREFAVESTRSGTETSLVLAIFLGASAVALPYSARLVHRWGPQRAYGLVLAGLTASFLLACLALALGAPRYAGMLVLAPFAGALQGLSSTLAQINLRAFSPKRHLQRTVALYGGLAAAAVGLGSPVSAGFVTWLGPVVCLGLHGMLYLPLLVFVLVAQPITRPALPKRQEHPWQELVTSLRRNTNLRIFCILGVLASIAYWPLTQIMVPLSASLGHDLLIHAGILAGSLALGSLASPLMVRVLERTTSRSRASLIGWSLAAATLLIIGLVAVVADDSYELLLIAPALFVLGALNNAARSFVISTIEKSKRQGRVVSNLATFFLAASLGMPIGTLLWGQLIDSFGGPAAMVASALLALGVMLFLYLRYPNPEHKSISV